MFELFNNLSNKRRCVFSYQNYVDTIELIGYVVFKCNHVIKHKKHSKYNIYKKVYPY